MWDDAGTRERTPLAITLSTPRSTMTLKGVRALLLITAGALGLGMLGGTAQLGPLTLETVLEVLVGWSFVACGTFMWARRPANRLGRLMALVGMLWLLGRTMTLVSYPVVYTAGLWLTDLWAPAFALFLLSFPTGRLTSRTDRAIVGIFLFVTVPLEFLWLLFLVLDDGLNALGIAPNESAAHVIDTIQRVLISLGSVLLVVALGRRWVRSSGPVRRQMWPVIVGGIATPAVASCDLLRSGEVHEQLDDPIRGTDRDPDRRPDRDSSGPHGPGRDRGSRRRARANPDAGPPPRCPRQRSR
jgi:hypothetical protein